MKHHKKIQNYTAIFERDPENGWYTVTVPALPGCISQGKTFENAVLNIKEAIELYLDVLPKKEAERIGRESNQTVIAPISITV